MHQIAHPHFVRQYMQNVASNLTYQFVSKFLTAKVFRLSLKLMDFPRAQIGQMRHTLCILCSGYSRFDYNNINSYQNVLQQI